MSKAPEQIDAPRRWWLEGFDVPPTPQAASGHSSAWQAPRQHLLIPTPNMEKKRMK